MITARAAATRALLAVTARQQTLATAIDAERRALTDVRDRGLALELLAGALRWRAVLDRLIEDASGRALASIDPSALAVLRIAVYQLEYLERVPDHAVVSESVETARAVGAARAAGFVNAVLRQAIRRRGRSRLPPDPGAAGSRRQQLAYLETTLSHPGWLVERWLTRVGYEATRRWCEWNNTPPTVTLRPRRGTAEALLDTLQRAGVAAEPAPFVQDAIRIPPGALGSLDAACRGAVWVQDEGAQLVARAAGVRPGERVLDLCAAPGGKSIVLARDLELDGPARSLLVSADFRPGRIKLLASTLRHDRESPAIVRLDARQPLPFASVFDCVVVDAPCSGLGTLSRDPDLKWTRTASDLPALVAVERQILDRAAEAVRPGGRLVYATCSSEPEENGEVVEDFLRAHRDFTPARVAPSVPDALVDPEGRLATRPDVHGLDAFFAATLVRHGTA